MSFDANSFDIGFFDTEAFELGEAVTITLSGTVTATITEVDIRAGGKTIELTINNGDVWVSGAAFDDIRQAIIDGLNGQ